MLYQRTLTFFIRNNTGVRIPMPVSPALGRFDSQTARRRHRFGRSELDRPAGSPSS
jgi:hypothetical protein